MLRIKNVFKNYFHSSKTVQALIDINLSVNESEFVAIVGPSGCGKTTLLRLAAGLEVPTSGIIEFNNQQITNPTKERGLAFQGGALYPWLTVSENVAFGLRLQNTHPLETQQRIKHYLDITGLKDFGEMFPQNLSGGMQQRVAFARMLATQPKLLLLDEPFGSLDTQTRSKMQDFLSQLWEKEKKMTILVTHDVREALFLADVIYVFSARPAQIKKIFKIHFSRPREHSLKYTQEFFNLEKEISQEI